MDLAAYFEDCYLPRLMARGVKPATLADYRAVVRSAPASPTASAVTCWLAGMHQPPATRNRKRRYLIAVLRDARRHGLVDGWIDDVPVAIESSKLPRAWTVAEFSRLLAACDRLVDVYECLPADAWWQSFLLTLWYTGARVGTLSLARTEDLDLAAATLVVTSTKDRRQILYQLPPDCCESIARLTGRRTLAWPWPYRDHKKTMLRRLRQLITDAGLPQLANPFHAIRRSVASYVAAEAGLSAACDLLDHCRPGITRRYYVDPRIPTHARRIGQLMPRPR